MGPWMTFAVEMTKALFSWPTVGLIAVLLTFAKSARIIEVVNSIADRIEQVSISKDSFTIKTLPRPTERPFPEDTLPPEPLQGRRFKI